MEVGGGNRRRPCSRPDAEEVGAGVDVLGPVVLAGDCDLCRCLDLDFDLFLPLEAWGGWCLAASSSAALAAALSCSVVGITPVWRLSIQNCPRAVLWPDPLRSFSVLCLFLVLDMCTAKLKSFSLALMYSL